jgi:hypothetical protein
MYFIHAACLEGADAHQRVDGFSDIDLWLDAEDGREDDALAAVRSLLGTIAPLELDVRVAQQHPLIRQAFFRLHGVPEFLLVDTCVQSQFSVRSSKRCASCTPQPRQTSDSRTSAAICPPR